MPAIRAIKYPRRIAFAGNPINYTIAVIPYREVEKRKNYSILLKVEVEEIENSDIYTSIKEMMLHLQNNGCASVDISSIALGYLSSDPPDINMQLPVALSNQAKRFRVSYQLLSNNQLLPSASYSGYSEPIMVLLAGTGYQDAWNVSQFMSRLADEKTFLRFPVPQESVAKDEYKFLSWVSETDSRYSQKVYLTLGYEDGTTQSGLLIGEIQMNRWTPAIVPAGYTQLKIDTLKDPSKRVVWYEISVDEEELPAECDPVQIVVTDVPDGVVGTPYQLFIALPGTPPVTVTDVELPAWASWLIDEQVMTISGTPVEAGQFNISISANNCADSVATFSGSINIQPSTPPDNVEIVCLQYDALNSKVEFYLRIDGTTSGELYRGNPTANLKFHSNLIPPSVGFSVLRLRIVSGQTLLWAYLNGDAATISGQEASWFVGANLTAVNVSFGTN